MKELRSWQTGWRLLIWIFTDHSPTVSGDGWYDNWFWYLRLRCQVTPFSSESVAKLSSPPLAASLSVCTFWSDWAGSTEPCGRLPTVYSIINRIATFWWLCSWCFKCKLGSTMTACAHVQGLLIVTNNSLELTQTDEGPRVWPGQ